LSLSTTNETYIKKKLQEIIWVYLFSQLTRLPGTGRGTAVLIVSLGCFLVPPLKSPVEEILVIQGILLNCVDQVHRSGLHVGRCTACCEAHMNFADELACLMADNVWNEGK
jgi:hypothetical protein